MGMLIRLSHCTFEVSLHRKEAAMRIASTTVGTTTSPSLPQRPLLIITLFAGLWIALGEVDRLITMVPAGVFSVSFNAASSFRLSLSTPSETASPWANFPALEPIAHTFIWAYFWLDLLFILTYVLALVLAARFVRALTPGSPRFTLLTRPRWQFAIAAGAMDLVENIALVLLVLSDPTRPAPHAFIIIASLSTTLKWILILLALLPSLLGLLGTREGKKWMAPRAKALLAHRYSLLAFLPIAGMGLIPASGVLEQLPDVQRSWFDFTQGTGDYVGLQHAGAAVITLLMVILGVFIMGRIVTDLIVRRSVSTEVRREPTPLWQWLYAPLIVGGLALLVLASGRGDVRFLSLAAFLLIPLGIAGLSRVLRGRLGFRPENAPDPRRYTADEARLVWIVGDMLALATAVVASLTLIRSHAVFTMLGHGSLFQAMIPVLGFALAVAAWPSGRPALEKVCELAHITALTDPNERPDITLNMPHGDTTGALRIPAQLQQKRMWGTAWSLIILGTVILGAVYIWPVDVADSLGVFGSLMFAFSLVALLIGATVIVHTFYAPPEVFWSKWFRLRESPIATLFGAFVVVALFAGSNTEVHGVRTFSESASPQSAAFQRHSPQETIDAWWSRTEKCRITLSDGVTRARPLVMVASKGGGIRAAYWTAIALQRMSETNPCALASIAVASGVSGGSMGLSISRFNGAGQANAVDEVRSMGQSSALSQATLGLLLRDPLYTVTGVPALTGFGPSNGGWNITDIPEARWVDRAGLMELDWEKRSATSLSQDFWNPPTDNREDKLSADLILNSTDAITGCRVLVSHIDATEPQRSADEVATTTRGCSNSSAPLPFSIDFYRQFVQSPTQVLDRCNGTLTAATASMLSARFPYVTPSGVVGPCQSSPQAQLIDGGYAEVTGLGSIIDLGPELLEAAAQKSQVENGDPVIPIVIYLDNDRGGDLLPAPPNAISELMIPITGNSNAATSQVSAASLLQRAAHLVGFQSQNDDAAKVSETASALLPGSVIVVSQRSEPSVAAPLGWILSSASTKQMDKSLEQEVTRGCSVESNNVNGYPSLGYLVNLFGACPAGVPDGDGG